MSRYWLVSDAPLYNVHLAIQHAFSFTACFQAIQRVFSYIACFQLYNVFQLYSVFSAIQRFFSHTTCIQLYNCGWPTASLIKKVFCTFVSTGFEF